MAVLDVTFINAGDNAELEAELDDSLTEEQVIRALIKEEFIPPIKDITRTYELTIKGRNMIAQGQTLADAGVRAHDKIRVSVTQRGGGGLIEILTVSASIGSIAQVVLMIADMWLREHKRPTTSKVGQNIGKQIISKDWDHIESIVVVMTDGTWIGLRSWLIDPENVKTFVQTFNYPSASPKPLYVRFVLEDHTAIRVNISDNPDNQQQLEQLIMYLKKP